MTDYVSGLIADWNRERPELDTSSMEVINRLLRASQILQNRLDSVATVHGLSHKGDLDVLTALRRSGPSYELSPTSLARGAQLTSGGMTSRLDRLEAQGLVSRRPDPTDRRGVLVGLTEDGRRTADAAFDDLLAVEDGMLLALSETQRQILATELEQLLFSLGDRSEPSANSTP